MTEQVREQESGEIPQELPLIEQLHAVLSEPIRDPNRRKNDATGRIQYEIVGDKENETHRYDPFFDGDAIKYDEKIGGPDCRNWPGMNLYVEKALVDTASDLIGGIDGKTVVHFRPEYYPFFGVLAAKIGAKTTLVDTRPIHIVEELINETKNYSQDLAKKTEQKLRESSGRKDLEASEAQMFWTLPSSERMAIYVSQHYKIDQYSWDKLNPVEKSHYIFKFIDEGGSLLTADISRYFGSKGYDSLENKVNFYDLPNSQKFPYTLSYLEENLDEEMRNQLWHIVPSIVGEKLQDKLSDDERFSMAIFHIYSKVLPEKFWNQFYSGKKVSDSETQDYVLNSMFQSEYPKDHQKIRDNLDFKYGNGLKDSDIDDKSVDILFSGWGLDFMENSVDFATNASRILKDNGIFVGYVKSGGYGDKPKRNLSEPDLLRQALEKCGFNDIVIVYQAPYENGSTSFDDIGLLFFAKKGIQTENNSTGLIITEGIPDSLLINTSKTFERTSIPVSERRKIEKTWNEDVDIKNLVNIFKENPEELEKITNIIYGSSINPTSDLDIENIIRGINIKFEDINSILGNFSEVKPEILEKLKDYFGKQEQIDFLLRDFSEAFIRINRYEDISEFEEIIRVRSEILGNPELFENFQKIKAILLDTTISTRTQELLDKAQEQVYKEMEKDPGHSYIYEDNLKTNITYYTALERRIKLIEVEENLANYFLNYDYSLHLDLDNNSSLSASIGRVHKIAQYEYLGSNHLVYFVDQNISLTNESTMALNVGGNLQPDNKKFVYLDRVSESAKTFLDRLLWVREDMPPLILKEWENITYLDDYIENRKREAEKLVEITNDMVHEFSIHEIQHSFGTGELGSYLAELAFGETPYFDLYGNVTQLNELMQEKTGLDSILRELGRIHESNHLQASIEILPSFIDAAIESGRLNKILTEKVMSTYSKNEAGFLKLDKKKAVRMYSEIMEALSYLTREEIHTIAIKQLKDRFDIEVTNTPNELSSNVPLLLYKNINSSSLPVKTEIDEIDSFSEETKNVIRLALGSENKSEKSKNLSELAITIANSKTDEALRLARNIPQKFQKEKTFIEIAKTAIKSGDKARALQILNEVEQIFESGKVNVGNNYPLYSQIGDRFFFYKELTEIMEDLDMKHDAFRFLSNLEETLLESEDPENKRETNFEILIDIALRKAKLGYKEDGIDLINRLKDSLEFNIDEHFDDKTVQFGLLLAKAKITGNKDYGKVIAVKLRKGLADIHKSYASYESALQVLVELDSKQEILDEYIRVKRKSESKEHNIEHYFITLADSLFQIGEKEKAHALRLAAFEEYKTISERQSKSGGYDWGFEFQILSILKHGELLDEAVTVAMNISDYAKRSDYLLRIGKRFLEIGENEKGVAVIERAIEYENDKFKIANINLLLESQRMEIN